MRGAGMAGAGAGAARCWDGRRRGWRWAASGMDGACMDGAGRVLLEFVSKGPDMGLGRGRLRGVIDEFAKQYLHDDLKWIRAVLLSKLDGVSEYDVRRPLTATGTNLLGLVNHLSGTEARYFSEVFSRPSPWQL